MGGLFGIGLEGGEDAFFGLFPEGLIGDAGKVEAAFLLRRRSGIVGKEAALFRGRSGEPFLSRS